ncbi:MmgE/PrpD family protein [Bordetella genomosp. 6]|uniref:MmgE/PrpD family protein n=1 Tax=Bordetella genomosp. 6 TaxID=463024 RepID=UPI000A28EDAD|nr:MmgE/PrpD family protein [Bordetella genomosp. 6]ARP76945.1 MmgE/PrpD family protein [Bordetella genomosp. 6]
MTSTAIEKIAAFVAGFDPAGATPAARHVAARALYDTIAAAIAGADEPASRLMMDYARGHSAPGMATVWATGDRLPVELAALVNGTMGHALDFDDVSSPLRGHPSVAIFPALVALGESRGASGKALIDAYLAGFEVTIKLARAIVDDQYAKGWHSTPSIAAFGATAACARLLGLDAARIAHAMGILVSQVAGTRQNFGTMSKPFQAGQANVMALRAALLAELGFDASMAAMDGPHGYTVLYADGQDIHAQLDTLGQLPLEIDAAGIEVKKYPLCYATHRAIQGVLDLRRQHALAFAEVERVEVKTNYRATVPLIYDRPRTGLEAKFSMHYAVAAALHDGAVNLASFEDAAVRRPAIQAFFEKVEMSQGEPPMFPRWAEVVVHLRGGISHRIRVDGLRGSAQFPLSDDELLEKGADCLAHGKVSLSAERLARACFDLDATPLQTLLAVLRPA